MTYEEALDKVIGIFDIVAVDKGTFKDADVVMVKAIELMKADAMQRQADAIERLANIINDCTVGTTFSGKRAFVTEVNIKK